MKKETYFNLVDLKKGFQARINELATEWNEKTCWFGTPEQQKAHENLEESLFERIREIDTALAEARKELSRDTLKQWADEYYGR